MNIMSKVFAIAIVLCAAIVLVKGNDGHSEALFQRGSVEWHAERYAAAMAEVLVRGYATR